MRHPQLLLYESDGRLAVMLEPVARERRWSLRSSRQPDECLALLEPAGPCVLVLKVGWNLEVELGLLERVRWLHPEAAVVVVGDMEHEALAGLLWDLGADYVLLFPQPHDWLPEIVAGLMGDGERDRRA